MTVSLQCLRPVIPAWFPVKVCAIALPNPVFLRPRQSPISMIIHFTSDLLSASALPAVAADLQIPFHRASSLPRLAETIQPTLVQPDAAPCLVIIDLQTEGLDLSACLELIENAGPIHTVAYAQHVYADLLDQAREAGIKRVLTRGELFRNARQLLLEFFEPPADA